MAYDEDLADRVRDVLPGEGVREQKMFGGLAFMYRGHMCVGILRDELMLRLGQPGSDDALTRPHVSPMDFTRKRIRTMVLVHRDGLAGVALSEWVAEAMAYVETLPPK